MQGIAIFSEWYQFSTSNTKEGTAAETHTDKRRLSSVALHRNTNGNNINSEPASLHYPTFYTQTKTCVTSYFLKNLAIVL